MPLTEAMGDTPTGCNWCVKALHPSDPVSECVGLPDESAVCSAHLNFQTQLSFQAPTGSTGTWGFTLALTPHPISFGMVVAIDDSAAHTDAHTIYNSQITGAAHSDKFVQWRAMAQRWRMTYYGATLYQDGADLTNQGSLVAAQYPVHGTTMALSPGVFAGGAFGLAQAVRMGLTYQTGTAGYDRPDFTLLSNMPNAYYGRSRDGCYVPLILTNSCQKWHGEHDVVSWLGNSNTYNTTGMPVSTAVSTAHWPFNGLDVLNQNGGAGTSLVGSDVSQTSRMANDVWGMIAAQNLALTTSFTVVIRCGYEIQCQPGTVLTPQLRVSPRYDPKALASYYSIRREMKDAYPADYNDWSKIWGVIKKVAATVLPGVAMMGPIGAGISAAAGPVASVIDLITNATAKKRPAEKGRNQPPQAEKERAQEAIRAREIIDEQNAFRRKALLKSIATGSRPRAKIAGKRK